MKEEKLKILTKFTKKQEIKPMLSLQLKTSLEMNRFRKQPNLATLTLLNGFSLNGNSTKNTSISTK
jgi:hypothetical protein